MFSHYNSVYLVGTFLSKPIGALGCNGLEKQFRYYHVVVAPRAAPSPLTPPGTIIPELMLMLVQSYLDFGIIAC